MRKAVISLALLAVAFVLLAVPAQAQSRVFVAAHGSDSNPCTFAAPCRTFQHAHDVVAANGEIDVLDPAGYGALTITKSISIQGHGFAGMAVPSGDGITVNAGPSDKINLRGLLLDGVAAGNRGIAFSTGASLNVQDCLIRNFTSDGIFFAPSASNALFVSTTVITDNVGGNGVHISNSGFATVVLDHVETSNNGNSGVLAESPAGTSLNLTLSDSAAIRNVADGILVSASSGAIVVMVRNSTFAYGQNGLSVGSNATLQVTKSTITGYGTGLNTFGGQIISFGDNSVNGNTTNGAPTSTIALK